MDGFVADVLRWARGVRASQAGDAGEPLHHFSQVHDGVLARLAATPRITDAVQAADPSYGHALLAGTGGGHLAVRELAEILRRSKPSLRRRSC
jgi:hypothetical protein